jgi:hypothetical protein
METGLTLGSACELNSANGRTQCIYLCTDGLYSAKRGPATSGVWVACVGHCWKEVSSIKNTGLNWPDGPYAQAD